MRTEEEIRANQAKYERMLDEAFGLAPKQAPVSPSQTFNPATAPVERMLTRCPSEALEFYKEVREAAEAYLKHYQVRISTTR